MMASNDVENVLGSSCARLEITQEQLQRGELTRLASETLLTNGLVSELYRFNARKKGQKQVVVDWILALIPESLICDQMLTTQYANRLRSQVYDLHSRRDKLRKRKLYSDVKSLETGIFTLPACSSPVRAGDRENVVSVLSASSQVSNSVDKSVENNSVSIQVSSCVVLVDAATETWCETKDGSSQTEAVEEPDSERKTMNSSEDLKDLNSKKNSLERDISLKLAQIENVDKKLEEKRSEYQEFIKTVADRETFYAKKNVDARHDYWTSAKKKLREKLRGANAEVKRLTSELDKWKSGENVREMISDLNESIELAKKEKKKASKVKSKYKTKIKDVQSAIASPASVELEEMVASTSADRIEMNDIIRSLEYENLELKDRISELEEVNVTEIETQKGGKRTGAFTDDVVLCTLQVLSMEVAAGKVAKVIRAVAEHIFHRKLGGLPNLQSAINIADTGHYLSKKYIAKELLSGTWGLNKDGTTRKKQKIVDTAVTLPSGEVMSTGFRRVAHEDARTTAQLCREELEELAEIHSHGEDETANTGTENFLQDALKNLSFLMNDRAASEKAANRVFLEWRDDTLDGDASAVHNFNCSAHVLLGFHRAAVKELKAKQVALSDGGTKMGRSAEPAFRFYRPDVAVERVACDTASTFGPVGHYLGLRDRWEAECSSKNTKSYLTSYKDNRFNGLFQTSLQIFYHRTDFLDLIEQVENFQKLKKQNLNLKIKSVRADLNCSYLMTFTQALGIMYVHVTGPFWDLVNSKSIKYLDQYKFFQPLFHSLEALTADPKPLLTDELHIIPDFPPKIDKLAKSVLQGTLPGRQDLLLETLSVLCAGFITVMKNQLKDFLPEGQYSTQATENELKRTAMSHLTNISWEHHLGSLDSSQRRRPNASYHHHSSVELLKKTLPNVLAWLSGMNEKKKSAMLASARIRGQILRKKHMKHHKEQEKIVKDELLKAEHDAKAKTAKKLLQKAKKTKQKGKSKKSGPAVAAPKKKRKRVQPPPVAVENFAEDMVGKYVAVIYSEPNMTWYPGIILERLDAERAKVKFLDCATTDRKNSFSWPENEQIDEVLAVHVFATNFETEPIDRMARKWRLTDYKSIEKKFSAYSRRY